MICIYAFIQKSLALMNNRDRSTGFESNKNGRVRAHTPKIKPYN